MTLQVLVIDDDQVDREAVRRYLSRPGRDISVHQAKSGAEGVACLHGEQKFDCVFLDYSLTDMDGVAFLREVYDKDAGQGPAPIVMLTGQGSESIMIDALHWGAQDYLVKNFLSTDMLYIALSKAIETFGLRRSRRLAEEQLRQSQKMEAVGQLTSGVAHDFNNLLTVILGNTRLLQRRLSDPGGGAAEADAEALAKKVQAIESAAKKGADLVQRLMVFTRQRPLEQQEMDINGRIGDIYELLKRTLGERIDIKTILAPDLWHVRIDPVQLENALINMAVNARDAMPDGGHLTVETSNVVLDEEYSGRNGGLAPGSYVLIAISDTGKGIPKGLVRRIFDPFFTTKAPGEGTGLGLSMVYGFIRQSGGHIHVYSEEDHGSVFRIYLPRYDGEELPAEASAEPMPTGSETILLVDDDEEVRSITKTMLEKLGYGVLTASDARMALEVLRQEAGGVDLLFTDIIMPGGMSGIDLVRKAREYYPALKSLYTSGYTEKTLPDYQLRVEQDLLAKPYRKEALAKKVREILDSEGKAA